MGSTNKSDEMNDEEPFAIYPFCVAKLDKDNNNGNNDGGCLMKNCMISKIKYT